MLSKNKIKLITSLQMTKYRNEHRLFVAEGSKLVCDLANSGAVISCLVATSEWLKANSVRAEETVECSLEDLKKASSLKSPSSVLALVRMPSYSSEPVPVNHQLVVALDEVQDPGNMGTIIRLADWFGIKTIVCSKGTVDCYNQKVVQATMGAIARVQIRYTSLVDYLDSALERGIPVYGTFLEGKSIYSEPLLPNGIVVMGNEGNGIGPEVAAKVGHKILIPDFSTATTKPESLNVSVAAAIVCSEFRRRLIK
jgi:RNA methyltransferase, TrmH family